MRDELFSVEGKRCLVTGASVGLGAHFAEILSSGGAQVCGISRVEPTATRLDGVDYRICDVSDEATVEAVVGDVWDHFDGIDILVNNAGVLAFDKALKNSAETMRSLFDINVIGATNVARAVARRMKASRSNGAIINIGSVTADTMVAGLSAYSASKAALEQMSKSMAGEWARFGIRVNTLAPGFFPTNMTTPLFDGGVGPVLKARIPMGRLGQFDDLDGAFLLLASDASKYMSGVTVTVDGGFSLIN